MQSVHCSAIWETGCLRSIGRVVTATGWNKLTHFQSIVHPDMTGGCFEKQNSSVLRSRRKLLMTGLKIKYESFLLTAHRVAVKVYQTKFFRSCFHLLRKLVPVVQ